MTAAFSIFEWCVRTGRFRSTRAAYVFPILMVTGGVLLLTHTHAISEVKEQVLTEWSHLPLGVLGVVGGAARWLEMRSVPLDAHIARWVWPVCLIFTALVRLNYREA